MQSVSEQDEPCEEGNAVFENRNRSLLDCKASSQLVRCHGSKYCCCHVAIAPPHLPSEASALLANYQHRHCILHLPLPQALIPIVGPSFRATSSNYRYRWYRHCCFHH